jgi:hypothetical protein
MVNAYVDVESEISGIEGVEEYFRGIFCHSRIETE